MERTIDRVALKKEAKRLLDGKVFKLLLCYAVYGIILAGCFALCFLTPNFLSQYFVGALENVQVISGIFTTETVQLIVWGLFLFVRVVLFMALAHPFSVCIATVPLAIAEGRIVSWKEAATPIRRLRYFIECMVTGAAQFLQTFFWAILFIVPGLLVHYRHSFTRYVFIENNDLTFGETAAQSKNLTKEFEGQLFLLDLSFLGWLLFGICTCGIGLLYLICYYSVTKVLYYKEVKKICQQESDEVPPPSGQTRVLEQQKVPTNQAPRTASHEGTESQPQGDDPQQEEAEPVAAENPTEPKEPAGHTEPNERQREAA